MCSGGSQHTQLILTFWLLYFVTSSCVHDLLTSASQRGVLTVGGGGGGGGLRE